MVRSHLGMNMLKIRRWLEISRAVHRLRGKSRLSQLWEIAHLHFGYGRLSAAEYYSYGLYDDRRLSPSDKREFISGERAEAFYRHLNDRLWYAIANDKLVCYAILQGLDLPIPRLYAIFHPEGRYFGALPCFRKTSRLADYLRHEVPYPFFSKPVQGRHGKGAAFVVAFDPTSDQLILANGEKIAVERYVADLPLPRSHGHLFQECLAPPPLLEEICGPRVSSLRMIVLLCSDGPHLARVIWKIPVGQNMTDNFDGGVTGNLIAQVDPETGLVKRVVRGVGLGQAEVAVHPDTGKPLTGFVLPDWDEVVTLCVTAASAVPGLRFQHWDIAMCRQGPVIIELNGNGNVRISQHAYGAGLYDAKFRTLLAGARR